MSSDDFTTLCDHLDVRVRDLKAARSFYDPLCAALGLTEIDPGGPWIVYEAPSKTGPFLAITSDPEFVPSRTRIAFGASSRNAVDRIAEVARRSGALAFESPHECPEYAEGYYAAFFSDADGNRYEICFRPHAL